MLKLLFVCHGNICRSVAAEFICKDLIKKNHLENKFYVESRATSLEEIGNEIYPPMREVLEKHNVNIDRHYSTQITRIDYERFDYIFVMDDNNMHNIMRNVIEDDEHKIFMITKFADMPGFIEDPWYTGRYEKVYNQLNEAIQKILEKLG